MSEEDKSLWDKFMDIVNGRGSEGSPDEPPPEMLADEDDELDWSWDALTGGERTKDTDEDVVGIALFAGVPEEEIEKHKEDLKALGGA